MVHSSRPFRPAAAIGALAGMLLALNAAPARAEPTGHGGQGAHHRVRFATFNASLNRTEQGELVSDLSGRGDRQAANVAEIIQRSRPDVLLVNEFDYDAQGRGAALFQRNYLSVPQHGAAPIHYRYRYTAPSNTGIPSGFDLDNDGTTVSTPGADGYGDDALGFGAFPGQYGMVVYSKYPIDTRHARTFQKFKWRDMPGAALPTDPATGEPWYDTAERNVLRLSSKSHWDLPVRVARRTVHFLVSHPTPPSFDGSEDRNGRRNHDEIRFWADYVRPGKGRYIYDDRGQRGGLRPGAAFVIAADMNADPHDGDSYRHAIDQLLRNRAINTRFAPTSKGGPEASRLQGQVNASHTGNPARDTADFADKPPAGPGNLRADYVLPSPHLKVRGGGVFWPTSTSSLARLTWGDPLPSSDHHLVWLDLRG